MADASVFNYSDYKEAMKAWIAESEGSSSWGLITQMAKKAQCQRSHLSRVLNGSMHLTPDQGYGLCQYWELTALEAEYFLALLDHARAASATYRSHLEEKLARLKREQENLTRILNRPRIGPGEKEITYYSAWHWSAIHILTSVPQYQTIQSISRKLRIDETFVQECLETLARFGMVKQDKGRWIFTSSDIHLPRESPLAALHHNNWRQRAVLNAQSLDQDSIHYTMVQSMSRQAYEKIKQQLVNLIDSSVQIAGPSHSEKMICIALDLFEE